MSGDRAPSLVPAGSGPRETAPESGACPVSVLIATRNEERNLPRCLDALRGWAREVVVVDSDSTDGTRDIARRHGAVVLPFRYTGRWPKKRQWALDTHDWQGGWILILDADEILTPEVRDEIRRAVTKEDRDGFWLRFRIVFLGRELRHGDTSLWKLALFRRGKGRYEQRLRGDDPSHLDMEVHEHVVCDGPLGRIRSPIRHENVNSLADYIDKHNGYSTWEAALHAGGQRGSYRPSPFGSQVQRRRWLKRALLRLPGSPGLRFLHCYLVRLGILDGRAGFYHAMFKAIQLMHVKAKLYERQIATRGTAPPESA